MKRKEKYGIIIITLLLCTTHNFAQKVGDENHINTIDTTMSAQSDIVIIGTIHKKKEIWDRRPNPLMGRPDILEEVVYSVEPESTITGTLNRDETGLSVSVTGRDRLRLYRTLIQQERGIFYLTGQESPYELLHFSSIHRPEPVKKQDKQAQQKIADTKSEGNEYYYPDKRYTDKQLMKMLKPPVRISSQYIFSSDQLQKRITALIAAKYHMKSASLITMISHRGPRPPRGGYKYWGVKGKIKGVWHVWQFGKLKRGGKLKDPKRYQK